MEKLTQFVDVDLVIGGFVLLSTGFAGLVLSNQPFIQGKIDFLKISLKSSARLLSNLKKNQSEIGHSLTECKELVSNLPPVRHPLVMKYQIILAKIENTFSHISNQVLEFQTTLGVLTNMAQDYSIKVALPLGMAVKASTLKCISSATLGTGFGLIISKRLKTFIPPKAAPDPGVIPTISSDLGSIDEATLSLISLLVVCCILSLIIILISNLFMVYKFNSILREVKNNTPRGTE